jgi:hypothetical protein
MNPEPDPNQVHVPAYVLWEYSRLSNALTSAQTQHLVACKLCAGILGIAFASVSLAEFRTKLREQNIAAE